MEDKKYNFIVCSKCKTGGGTLQKVGDTYIHEKCEEVNQNNRRERRRLYKQLMKKS